MQEMTASANKKVAPATNQNTGVVFDAKKKDEDQKTINDIIKRSMTNKYEEDMSRDDD